MKPVTIREISAFVTAPQNINLVVVKIETSEPGLVGWGCATFTWRYAVVVTAIRDYLRPLLAGRPVNNIEDIWQSAMGSSYWRNSAVLNNALSGVDEALWDIKGKLAGMPLYELFGGKCREGIAIYRHADGLTYDDVSRSVRHYLDEGCRHIRCHIGSYGGNADGSLQVIDKPDNAPSGAYYHPGAYRRSTVALFERLRDEFGWEVELLHDVHERLPLADALAFAKEMEPYKLFYLEDPLPPDQVRYLAQLRRQTTLPLAMGELFTHPLEWREIVQNQWIDFIRVHLSAVGGLTPARKLAVFCEAYGIRTAWHGPNDLSPVGVAAQMHLDYSSANFGIQEFAGFSEAEQKVFPGCPQVRRGYAYLSDRPGIGVDFDEEEAAGYPPVEPATAWLFSRLPDGTAVRP